MTSQYKYLSRALKQNRKWGRAFRWQWRVVYQVRETDGVWRQYEHLEDNRAMARYFKRTIVRWHGTHNIRWVKLQRRLVAVDWEDYHDTFSYSAKGNGNGR